MAGSDPEPDGRPPEPEEPLEPDPVALAQARVEHATLQVAAAHSARSARQDELARSRAACLRRPCASLPPWGSWCRG